MSDIRIYTEAQASSLVPLTGDVILCTEAFNGALANSVHLCTNATGPVWKSFENDAAVTPPFNEYSLSFDGTNDHLETGEKFDFIQTTGNFTISAWVKFTDHTSTSNIQSILGTTYTSSSKGFYLFYDNRHSAKTLRVLLPFLSTASIDVNNGITDNNWHNIVVTGASGGNITLYKDASQIGTASTPSTTSTSALYGMKIGTAMINGAASNSLNGKLDEVAIFNSALTSEQVASLRDTSGANPVPADISGLNPSAWYRMGDDSNDTFVDGGSVSSITDSSGNGYTATQATAANQPTFSVDIPS